MKNLYSFNHSKGLFGLLFLLMSLGVWGQTLVEYNFNNTLAATVIDPGIQTPPTLKYYNSNNQEVPASYNGSRLHLANIGDYLELTIDTRGYSNLTLSFDAWFTASGIGGGVGTWEVSLNPNSNVPTSVFNPIGDLSIFSFWGIEFSNSFNQLLDVVASNNEFVKIRIRGDYGTFLASPRLRLDNLLITYGNPIIEVFNSSNTLIPHESLASFVYDTEFNSIPTVGGTQSKVYTIENSGSADLIINSITKGGANPDDFIITGVPTLVPPNESRNFTVTFDPTNDGIRTADILINSNSAPATYMFNVQGRGVSCSLFPGTFQANSFGSGTPSLNTIGTYAYVSGNSGNSYRPRNTNMFVTNGVDTRSWVSSGNPGTTLEFGPVDISNEKNVSISFYVAAFTNGSGSEGVNNGSHIRLSVWNPITNNWSQEMHLQGSSANDTRYYYPFFTSANGLFEVTYDGDNSADTRINSGNTNNTSGKVGTFKLNIPESYGNQLRFRIQATTSAATSRFWLIDEVKVNSENIAIKTYTNSGWIPSAPAADEKAVIQGNLTLPAGDYNVCECEVQNGGSLILQPNANLTLQGKLVNNGNFVSQNNANLIQIENEAQNTGSIKVEKTFTFTNTGIPANDRKQYNFVISPVVGQNIKGIYPPGNLNPAVIEYRESNNFFYNHSGAYTAGKGYAIKEPSKTAVPASTLTANFNGLPFNGELVYPLSHSAPGNDEFGYNLIGNPYPSNLDIQLLYNRNTSIITPTFYFWDNRGNTQYTQQGSNYDGSNYAIFNAINSTGVPAGGAAAEGAPDNSRIPNRYVKVGTAFMVQATQAGQSIHFDNSMRSNNNSGPGFFGKNLNPGASDEADPVNIKDRFWLTLTTPSEMEFMNAVVYFEGGNNQYGLDDSDALGGSDEIFTVVGQQYLAINGRAPFENSDVVPLGVRHFADGKYIIDIHNKEGVFANGQKIYLKDNYLNRLHELSMGYYEYESEAGEFIDRFEIVYKNGEVTEGPILISASQVQIQKINNQIVISSQKDKLIHVEVFNFAGWSEYKNTNVNALELIIPAQQFGKQILVIRVQTETGEIVTRKMINK